MNSPARKYVSGLALVYAVRSYQKSFSMFSLAARARIRQQEAL